MAVSFQEAQKSEAGRLLEYGRSLYEFRRYADAESKLREALACEPQNWLAHYYLASALLAQVDENPDKLKDGLSEAKRTVALSPDHEGGYFLMAWGYLLSNKHQESLDAAHQGMRINPQDAWGYSLVCLVYHQQSKWEKMLQAAHSGLKYAPDHSTLLNLQAEALIMLGRKAEALTAVEMALRSDPSSSYAHTNRGWLALYTGDTHGGLGHFREALRLDPTSESARQGLVQSLHARNPFYVLLLRYYLWTRRLSRTEFWAALMMLSVANRVLSMITRAFPPLILITLPFFLIYGVFSFFTWIGDSFFNLILKLSPSGRLVLSKDESASANGCGFMGALFLINAAALVAALFLQPDGDFTYSWVFFVGAVLSVGMMMPLAGIYKVDASMRKRRMALVVIAALLGTSAACGWSGSFVLAPWHGVALLAFLIGWFIYPLAANIIMSLNG